ncbi:hypothetical protein BH10ACT8_BH10ACT8_09640 [soil metagenome]
MRPTGPDVDLSRMDAVTIRQSPVARMFMWLLAFLTFLGSLTALSAGWTGLLVAPLFVAATAVAICGARATLKVTASGIEIRTVRTTRIPASEVLALEIRAAPRTPRPNMRQIVAVCSGGKDVRLDLSTMQTDGTGQGPLIAVRDQMTKALGFTPQRNT